MYTVYHNLQEYNRTGLAEVSEWQTMESDEIILKEAARSRCCSLAA